MQKNLPLSMLNKDTSFDIMLRGKLDLISPRLQKAKGFSKGKSQSHC